MATNLLNHTEKKKLKIATKEMGMVKYSNSKIQYIPFFFQGKL